MMLLTNRSDSQESLFFAPLETPKVITAHTVNTHVTSPLAILSGPQHATVLQTQTFSDHIMFLFFPLSLSLSPSHAKAMTTHIHTHTHTDEMQSAGRRTRTHAHAHNHSKVLSKEKSPAVNISRQEDHDCMPSFEQRPQELESVETSCVCLVPVCYGNQTCEEV